MNAHPALRPWRRASIAAPAPAAALRRPAPGGEPLPARLRRALEHLSGLDLGGVRVHRGSALPALLGARAFAYGERIYLSSGAEAALAHEAWHVVQQMQGRVAATGTVNGLPLNDDAALEAEAEARAAEVLRLSGNGPTPAAELRRSVVARPVVQRFIEVNGESWTLKTLPELREQIDEQVQLSDLNVPGFVDILTDMIEEHQYFGTWAQLAREIRIREVGYAAVSELEKLLAVHRPEYTRKVVELEEWKAEQYRLWKEDEQKERSQRKHYADDDALGAAIDAYSQDFMSHVLTWGNAAYVSNKFLCDALLARPMFQWLTGTRSEAPLVMNCWELVLWGLYSTGAVDKRYIAWANSDYAGSHPLLPGKKGFLNLTGQVLSVMENVWASDEERAGGDTRSQSGTESFVDDSVRRVANPAYFTHGKMFCVDGDRRIPRGRILMFDAGAHFAISSGRKVPIRNPDAVKVFKRKMGHGMIELDAGTGTIRESTIEDLPERYLKSLVAAPFPICPETSISISKNLPRNDEEREQLRAQLKVQIDESTEAKIAEVNNGLSLGVSAAEQSRTDENGSAVDRRIANLRTKAAKEVEKLRRAAETELRTAIISEDKANPKKVSFTFDVPASDPYAGFVHF